MDWEPNTASYTGVEEFEETVWFHSADVTQKVNKTRTNKRKNGNAILKSFRSKIYVLFS
jgi:hypothetical protein